MKLVAVLSALAAAVAVAHGAPRVDSRVHRALRREGTVNLIVTMRDSPARALAETQRRLQSYGTRGDMLSDFVSQLKQHAESSQAEITKLLAHESGSSFVEEVKSFWVSNQLYFRAATYELVMKLAEIPGIESIVEEQVRPLPTIMTSPHASGSSSASGSGSNGTAQVPSGPIVEWGISKIQATDVWAMGNKGRGAVVGIIDTGVRATHEALFNTYRGEYGWYDPEKQATEPYDSHGHGSHVTGTIAGDYGIGVAPQAHWIMCKGCRGKDCYDSDLLACAQFMTCPTDPKGQNADCSKAPRIVSNSWGYGQGDKTFDAAIATWRQAGIIPIFSIGNNGSECATAQSPGDNANVISVGATDREDSLAWYSNRGPSVTGLLKPEVSAPGSEVVSAWARDDQDYVQNSGTSMAAPHVSGAVALLVAARPNITYDEVRELLLSTTDQAVLRPTFQTCGGSLDGIFPNNMYGHGRINALSILKGCRGPTPPPTPAPTTVTPPPMPDCVALNATNCEDTIFCAWHANNATCTPWWE